MGPVGNTTFAAYPVFRKDFRLLFKFMLAALAMQAFITILIELGPADSLLYGLDLPDWFPKLQIAVSVIIGLVAAGYFFAEEHEGGNIRFLCRLAAPRKRILTEKIAAGFCIVLTIIICQFLWAIPGEKITGIRFWQTVDIPAICKAMIAGTLIGYLIGLPLSFTLRRTISVVLVGICIEGGIFWLIYRSGQGVVPVIRFLLFVLLGSCLPIAALVWSRVAAGRKPVSFPPHGSATWQLIRKQGREKIVLHALIAVVVAVALLSIIGTLDISYDTCGFLMLITLVLSTMLGISTYCREEKAGISCVLYHHPASLNRIFWAKFCHGLVGALVLDFAFTALILETYVEDVGFSWSGATFVALLALLPYCCGVLFTHTFALPLYATMAGIFSVPALGVGVYYLLFSQVDLVANITSEYTGYLSHVHPPLVFLITGLILAAWRTATDRALLTAPTTHRLVYVMRLFVSVFAVVTIIEKTGWRDLLYLVTNINLGSG